MPTAIIYETGSDAILKVIRNATKHENAVIGDTSFHSKGFRNDRYSVRWVDDSSVFTPIMVGEKIAGYAESVSDYPELSDKPEFVDVQRAEIAGAIVKMNDLAGWTFQELDDYIDVNVVDMASAKVFIKRMAKVLLALIKLVVYFVSKR